MLKIVHATWLTLVCYIVIISSVNAQEKETIGYAKEISLSSTILKRDLNLWVFLPNSFHHTSERVEYPVIYFNGAHGHQFFHTLTGITNHLGKLERMPESIVVTIDGDTPDIYTNGMWGSTKLIPQFGSEQQYMDFLEKELFPYLAKNYRANENRTVIGISGSSLFPLVSYAKRPHIFDKHIYFASHDMLGMGLKEGKDFSHHFEQQLSKDASLDTGFYLAVADQDMINKRELYQGNADRLANVLNTYQKNGVISKIEIIPNENHYNAFIKAILSAFEFFYPQKQWAPNYKELANNKESAMVGLSDYFSELSRVNGFEIKPKVFRWNSPNSLPRLYRNLIKDKKFEDALAIAQYWAELSAKPIDANIAMAKSLIKLDKKRDAKQLLELSLSDVQEGKPSYKEIQDLLRDL